MLLEFTSTRPPGPARVAGQPRRLSYWPSGAILAAGFVLTVAGDLTGTVLRVLGEIVVVAGGCLLANAAVTRRRPGDASREPRHWTITEDDARSGNHLGSVRLAVLEDRGRGRLPVDCGRSGQGFQTSWLASYISRRMAGTS